MILLVAPVAVRGPPPRGYHRGLLYLVDARSGSAGEGISDGDKVHLTQPEH